ncbi:CE1759 family FMN reductase [Kribbella sp. GL6]|uniref:CE1759 family FMN reductase n=1 Tax=Kribbella sp. GL6 TaxID=3419765 RepID=UPI003CFDF376
MNPLTIAVITAGTSDPSSTKLLADRIAQKTVDVLRTDDRQVSVTVIDLAPIAVQIAQSLVRGFPDQTVQNAIDRLAAADAIIASTPVYKAAASGLFKSFVDLIDNDLLVAKPVILAATGGTARHAMVPDDQLRPLFAFLRAIPVPTSLYAAPEDWGDPDLTKRITRAANELAVLIRSGAPDQIADGNWDGYQHQFAGNATRADHTADDLDFTTDLMRLAAGGSSR